MKSIKRCIKDFDANFDKILGCEKGSAEHKRLILKSKMLEKQERDVREILNLRKWGAK